MPTLRSGRLQHHQLFGISHRQSAQQDLVQQGKNSGIRANPQRQREDRDQRKARVLGQHPQAVPHVLQKRVHLFNPPRAPAAISYRAQKSGPHASAAPSKGSSYYYFNRTRSKLSQADMSERITLSPTFNPSKISIVFTELRPNFTLTRTASAPSSMILKIPIVLFSCPC